MIMPCFSYKCIYDLKGLQEKPVAEAHIQCNKMALLDEFFPALQCIACIAQALHVSGVELDLD